MTPWSRILLTLALAGMEVSWRYAWALFLTLLTMHHPFPLPAAVGACALGALFTHIAAGKNQRVIHGILLHSAGFALYVMLTLYLVQYRETPFLSRAWINHLFLEPRSAPQWWMIVLFLSCLWLFWHGGQLLVQRPKRYPHVCLQFDKGLGLFFLLLVINALIVLRADLHLQSHVMRYLILAFFIFSLTSIALSRGRSRVQKTFMLGYRGIGLVLSGLAMVGIFAAGTTLLTYPYLYTRADALMVLLKNAADPMKPWFIRMIVFLFQPRNLRLSGNVPGETEPAVEALGPPAVEGWEALLLKIIGAGLMGLITLAGLGVLLYLITRLVQWLLRENSVKAASGRPDSWIRHLFRICQALFLKIWKNIASLLKGDDCAASIYYQMLGWGKRSGLMAIPSETPIEYGNRLQKHFPKLQKDIIRIVEAFNQETYAHTVHQPKHLIRLRSAHRRMKHIRYWPSRIKTWFRQ